MNSEPNIIKGEAGAAPPASLDLRFFYYVVFRHKWKIAFLFAAGLSAAVAVCFVKGPVYQSEAKLLVRYVLENEGRSLSPTAMDSQLKSPDPGGSSIINGEMEMLGSFDLAQQVADSVGADRILGKLGKAGGETNRIRAALVIQGNIHTEAPGKSSVIRVIFQHPDAELVQPVLSQLITNYLDRHFKLHLAPGVFNDFLSNRTAALGNELKETEDRLRELKQSIGVVSVEDTKKAYAERMSKTGAELFSAMAELAEQKAMLEEPGKAALLNTNSSAAATVKEEKAPPRKVEEYNALSGRVESFRKKENDYLTTGGYAETSDLVKGVRERIAELEQKKRRLEEEYPQLTRHNLAPASGGTQGGFSVALMDPVLEGAKKIRALEAKIKVLNDQLDKMRAEAAPLQIYFHGIQPRRQFALMLTIELDDQDRSRLAMQEITQSRRLGIKLRAVEHVFVDNFYGTRAMRQDERRRRQRVEQFGELDNEQRLSLRQRSEPQLRLQRNGERALRTDEKINNIDPV